MEALEGFGFALLRSFGVGLVAQGVGEVVEVDVFEKIVDCLGAHFGNELVGVGVVKELVFAGETVDDLEVFFLGEEVETLYGFLSFGCNAGVDDHVAFVVDDCIEFLRGKTQEVADLIGE